MRPLRVFVLLLLASASSPPSPAQTLPPDAGAVHGTVTDPTGFLVPNARVSLVPAGKSSAPAEAVPQPPSTQTTPEGRYAFTNIPPGTYIVRVAAEGFAAYESAPLRLLPARPQTLDVHLALQTAQLQMNVTADSTADTDPNRNGDAIVLRGQDLATLATDPTTLQQEIQALTGGDAPTMYVDGFSGGTLPPKDTIREIRINQNPYSARNDTDPVNGMIEIFTKPGADKVHASFFIIGNDSSFNTRSPFAPNQPPYYFTQYDGNLSGPLNKHASYFFNASHRSSATNSVIDAEVLDSGFQQINLTQAVPSPSSSSNYSPRIDLQLGERSTLSLRYTYANNTQTNAGVGQFNLAAQAYNTQGVTQTLQASNSQVLTTRIVNDTRFQYVRTRSSQAPFSAAPTLNVEGAFTDGGNSAGASHDNNDRYELQNYLSIQAGKHYLSPGVRLRINRDASVSRAGYNGQFTFPTLAAYQAAAQSLALCELSTPVSQCNLSGASQFTLTTGAPAALVDVVDLAAFYQDDWKLAPHFTLSYGLRYEVQNYEAERHDLAPRLAFSWGLGATDKKPARFVVRAGTGIFYTRLASGTVLQAARQNGIAQQQYIVANPAFYPNIPAPSTLGPQSLPTLFQISPSYTSPYTWNNTVALDHPLGKHGSMSFNYVYNRGVHVGLTRNINSPLPGTYNPAVPASGVRPLGTLQNIDQYESSGVSRTNRLFGNLNFHGPHDFFVYAQYQLRYRHQDVNQSAFPSNEYNLAADYGRGWYDIRHNFLINIEHQLPHLYTSAGVFLNATSGQPFNIVVGQDLNGDSQFNDRPAFATDLSRPSVLVTRYGAFDTAPMAGQTIIPINYGQGPAHVNLNFQLYHEFSFGPPLPKPPGEPNAPKPAPNAKPEIERRYHMFLALESENAINHVNLGQPVGILGSPLFGQSTSLAGGGADSNANRTINLLLFFNF